MTARDFLPCSSGILLRAYFGCNAGANYDVLPFGGGGGRQKRPALFALAEAQDPNMLAAWSTPGVPADVARAQALYRKALTHGISAARGPS